MAKRLMRGQSLWVPEQEWNPEWVHARAGGCGGLPRTPNPDRVTCPTCLTPEAHTEKTVVEDDE